MKRTEEELNVLKDELSQMWRLVISQIEKAKQSLLSSDKELALEVISREKRVDALELKIDCDCENYIAIYAPVAIDLRLVLSMLKINNALERIADYAEGIARDVVQQSYSDLHKDLIDELKIERMFDVVISMLSDSFVLFDVENSRSYGKILSQDDELDFIYNTSFETITTHLQKNHTIAYQALMLTLLVKKLERLGDHCSNIVEEIVFYLDAKVLKHKEPDLL